GESGLRSSGDRAHWWVEGGSAGTAWRVRDSTEIMLGGKLLMPPGWPTFEPVGAVVAILTLSVAFVLACLDCHLRHDRRPLPMVSTTAAMTVLWAANLIAFSGVVPGLSGSTGMLTASWIFLVINVTGPT